MEHDEALSSARLFASLAKSGKLPKHSKGDDSGQMESSQADPSDPFKDKYGDLPMIQSRFQTPRVWTKVQALNSSLLNQEVLLRARAHSTRIKGKGGFLILRESCFSAQCTIFAGEKASIHMVKYVDGITMESVVEVLGVCKAPKVPIETCSQLDVEVEILEVHVVSRAQPGLPLQILDAAHPVTLEEELAEQTAQDEDEPAPSSAPSEERKRSKVHQRTRLDNRVLDLRTPANQAVLRIDSGVCRFFREYLHSQGFVEIHTPKLLGGTSEGGANVFRLKYFNKEACLAQSPQLFKQMALMADLDRVFEIGPVFRAEDSNTYRHLCEFTGLDFEMTIKEHYNELMSLINNMFIHIFKGIEREYAPELAAVHEQFPFISPFQYSEEPLWLTFPEAVKMLNDVGVNQKVNEDLNTENEKRLGGLVKEKYHTDFYIVHRYPSTVRPFYTMPCADDPDFTCSYDVFMRGEEIISGAQRLHDAALLEARIRKKGVDVRTVQDYVNSFKYGAFPHGGCGVGLERVVMLYLGLKNIRRVSMFPRDPKRLTP